MLISRKGHQQELLLLRGIPGAGKSTFGRVLASQGWRHFESDIWRDHGEARVYNSKRNEVAHGWCFGQAAEALRLGNNVVVANVFSTIDRMKPYFMLAEDLRERGHKIKVTVAHIEGPVGCSINEGVTYTDYINEWQRYVGEYDGRAG